MWRRRRRSTGSIPAWATEQGHGDALLILADDLNDVPHSDTLRELEKFWTIPEAGKNSPPTFPSGHKQIDYVFVHPADALEVSDYQVLSRVDLNGASIDTRTASDHYPVLMTVRVAPIKAEEPLHARP